MSQVSTFGRKLFFKQTDLEFERQAVLNPAVLKQGDEYHFYYRAVAPDMKSTIGYALLRYENDMPVVVRRLNKPLLSPVHEWEMEGIEDPRVIFFEDKFYMFYTAFDGDHAALAYAVGDSPTSFTERFVKYRNLLFVFECVLHGLFIAFQS